MAYSNKVSDTNKANADLRPDGKGGMVHKSKVMSKRQKAKARLRARQRAQNRG